MRTASGRHARVGELLPGLTATFNAAEAAASICITREDQFEPRFRRLTWRSPIAAGSGFVASNGYPARSLARTHMSSACPIVAGPTPSDQSGPPPALNKKESSCHGTTVASTTEPAATALYRPTKRERPVPRACEHDRAGADDTRPVCVCEGLRAGRAANSKGTKPTRSALAAEVLPILSRGSNSRTDSGGLQHPFDNHLNGPA